MMNKWFSGLQEWMRLNMLLLVCMVAIRPLFFLEVLFRVGLEPEFLLTILSGAMFDALLVGRIFIYGLIPFLLIHYFFPQTARGIATGLIVAFMVVTALLAEYYCNLTMPLDHVILVYTPEELKTTVSSSASLSFAQVFWFVLMVGVSVLLIWLWRKVKFGKWFVIIVAVLFLLDTLFVRYPKMVRKESLYRTHYRFCLAVNQPSYSYVKITDFMRESKQWESLESNNDEALQAAIEAYHARHPEFEFDHPGYPFYHKTNDADVLGPYFNTTSDSLPPNLVFIIVEGLGRRLTGTTHPQISFTPFIDSLAAEGLFWPNCLSTSERTFGVLPSVYASAPHGRYGFSTNLAPTPRHHSFLLDLEQNGYTTSFYYGGDMSFDRYDFFMKSNHVDYLFMPQIVVEDSAKYLLLSNNHRWGLDDDELFRSAIAHQKLDTVVHRPYLDMYLTLSTHEPFLVDDIEKFKEQAKQMVDQTPTLLPNERNNILKNLNIYGCYLYTDQSIRELFAYYAARPDFENTIFVITGDHRMAPVSMGIALRLYNVPLVVYSPLLKQPKTMKAVVSHLDIAPSFNAFLSNNYNYVIGDHCHWLGTSFDTVTAFRNLKKQAFMRNNRDVVDYVNGEEMIVNAKLYKFDSLFEVTPVDDEQRCQELVEEMTSFDMLSRYVVQNDVLLPRDAKTILYNIHLDFENNTLEVYDKYLVRRQGYLSVGDNVESFGLGAPIVVRPMYENLVVDVSFDVKNKDTQRDLPVLSIGLGNDYWSKCQLENTAGESLNTGKWEHFHTRIVVNTLDIETTEALRMALLNTGKTVYELDNLVVTVEGVKKEE